MKSFKFELFIQFTILVSSVNLALENPLNDPDGALKSAVFYIDVFTTSIFIMEAMMKTVAFGFVANGRYSYLRSYWNIIDFAIVILSVI